MTYRADPPEGLRIVPVDSLTAIYHRASGQTHVVAEPMPEILAVLSANVLSIDDLIQRLRLADDVETRALLTERLAELVEAGLVTQT